MVVVEGLPVEWAMNPRLSRALGAFSPRSLSNSFVQSAVAEDDRSMDSKRRAVIDPLIELASSPDHRDRADAGRGLAVFADTQQARDFLVALVLDTHDTFVTRVTAQAVLRRQDKIGYAIVSRALAVADNNHSDWIHTAIVDIFGIYAAERDAAVRECQTLLDDNDETVQAGTPSAHDRAERPHSRTGATEARSHLNAGAPMAASRRDGVFAAR